MNVLRLITAITLSLTSLFLAIPLALCLLIVVGGLTLIVQPLINRLGEKSKAYKIYEVIVRPFADCFEKIMNILFQELRMAIFTKEILKVYDTDLKEAKEKLKNAKTRLDIEVLGERVNLLEGFVGTLITILDFDLDLDPDNDEELEYLKVDKRS